MLNEYNKYKKQLTTYATNIYSINSKVMSINNGQTIDIGNAKNKLPNIINSLISINKNLESYTPNSKYKSTFDSLKLGLDNNILMYKQLYSILNNLESNDINTSMTNVINYKNACNKYYGAIKSSHKNFSLPEASITFINNSSSYVSNFIKIKNNRDIINTQNMEFENSINDIIRKFDLTKTDLSYYSESARKNSISYDNAIIKVQNNKDNFNNIFQQFSQINVPQNQIELYKSVNQVLSDYNSYVDSFLSSLKKEKASSLPKISSDDIDDIYKDSNDKYITMNNDFNKLKNTLKNTFNTDY